MSFLRPYSFADALPPIQGVGVELRAPEMSDFAAWAELRARSRLFLTPWEPTWPADDLTRTAFRARMKRYARDARQDQAYPFFVFRQADGALVGGLTIGQIRRGVSLSGTIGYWIGEPYARQGLMTAALSAAGAYAFGALALRRLEAACIPTNTPSIRLLERAGFQREGYARQYLCIAGEWRDHLLFGLIATDKRPT